MNAFLFMAHKIKAY